MLNAVGSDITFQLVGASGPVDLGVFQALDAKPAPKVNERELNDGTVSSESINIGFWTLSIERPKTSLAFERLVDLASSPATIPTLQAIYMIRDPNTGEIGQWLFTGLRFRGFGTNVSGGVVNETAEFSADKRTSLA
jgi:hypothetical protein